MLDRGALTPDERARLDGGARISLPASRVPGLCPTCQADVDLQKFGRLVQAWIRHDDGCPTQARRRAQTAAVN
jgi:hypothetical protein